MKYELSLCLPGIRPHFWKNVYDSALTSCKKYSFEIVFVSPYDLPAELAGIDNIKMIKDFGSPVRATQIGALNCSGKLITFPCDDGVFLPDALDACIDMYNSVCQPKDGMVMRYREHAGMVGKTFPPEYWIAVTHLGKDLYIEDHWKIAPQPMLSLEYYKAIGGVDCELFECMAFATHDLCYRMQRDGGVFHLSPTDVMNADNYGETGVDHAPIFYGQTTHDEPIFRRVYSKKKVLRRVGIDFDNWKKSPELWDRRWPNGKTV